MLKKTWGHFKVLTSLPPHSITALPATHRNFPILLVRLNSSLLAMSKFGLSPLFKVSLWTCALVRLVSSPLGPYFFSFFPFLPMSAASSFFFSLQSAPLWCWSYMYLPVFLPSLSYLSFARAYTVISISLFLFISLPAQIWLSSPTFTETVTVNVTFILLTQCPIAKSFGVKKTCKIICGIWGSLNTDYLLSRN